MVGHTRGFVEILPAAEVGIDVGGNGGQAVGQAFASHQFSGLGSAQVQGAVFDELVQVMVFHGDPLGTLAVNAFSVPTAHGNEKWHFSIEKRKKLTKW
jgi:hypothetical protein